jgi:flagellin
MALTVNTNIASMNALTNLNRTTRRLAGTFTRISSGLRVNKAADDAAGLAVAENLSAAYRSSRVALRNINDGISVLQTAEGATNEVINLVKRMRELAVQSASETLADTEREYIQDELVQLVEEVDRIANSTEFNGLALGDGTETSLDVQVGINNTTNDRIAISVGDLRASVLGVDLASINLQSATTAQAAIDVFEDVFDQVASYRSDYGAVQNRLESAMRNMETYAENLAAAESQIRDADFAYETAQMAKDQILQQAGVAILAQTNLISQGALSLLQ